MKLGKTTNDGETHGIEYAQWQHSPQRTLLKQSTQTRTGETVAGQLTFRIDYHAKFTARQRRCGEALGQAIILHKAHTGNTTTTSERHDEIGDLAP